jgi:hypothetical protein
VIEREGAAESAGRSDDEVMIQKSQFKVKDGLGENRWMDGIGTRV